MATTTQLTPIEVHDRLQELLKAATERASAECRIERIAAELGRDDDWTDGLRFAGAVAAEIRQALYDATTTDDMDALMRCQSIQDAIDVLKFAMERDDAR